MIAYFRRVRAARAEERAAQTALNFDYDDRLAHDGPWEEDDTYLPVLTASPPIYQERCRHCGAVRQVTR